MCFPPLVQPARNCMGCMGLRNGAAVVLMVDAFYGLVMVVLHSMLLAEVQEPVRLQLHHSTAAPSAGVATHAELPTGQPPQQTAMLPGGAPGGRAAGALEGSARRLGEGLSPTSSTLPPAELRQPTSLFVQLLDLDFGWGHRLLGFQDKSGLTSGLIYGIVIIAACLYMLSLVLGQTSTNARPILLRWFVGFMHVQMILFIFLFVVKMAAICDIQPDYLPHLDMDCPLLRASYAQRVVVVLAFFLVGTWIFASFTWFLTFGQGAEDRLDKPQFGAELDMDPRVGQPAALGNVGSAYLSRLDEQIGNANGSFLPQRAPGGAGGPAASYGPQALAAVAPSGRHSVGGPSHGQSFGGLSAAGQRMPMSAGVAQRPSYNLGGQMARASSSMVTSTTEHSQAETQALIKPPVAVF